MPVGKLPIASIMSRLFLCSVLLYSISKNGRPVIVIGTAKSVPTICFSTKCFLVEVLKLFGFIVADNRRTKSSKIIGTSNKEMRAN